MTPLIKLQEFSLLVYKMEEQFEKVKRDRRMDGRTDGRTEQGNNNIPELSLESAGIINKN